MTDPGIPAEILALAEARAAARRARDWPAADRLRAELEAAGWKVVDEGVRFRLSPAHPPDVEVGGRIRYGRSGSVPSRLEEPATGLATVVLLATDPPSDLERTLAGLRAYGPLGTQVVVVADAPTAGIVEELERAAARPATPDGHRPEMVLTSDRLGYAAATNAGVRRAAAPVVVLLDTSLEPVGDFLTPLVRVLDDPSVAVVGGWGIVSRDLRHFDDGPAGDVDAVEGYCQAFRREDYRRRGPLDERFRFYRNLDIWWSLVLRDEGERAAPRRALRIDGLPLVRHEHRGYGSLPPDERDRLSKRNFYRILDRFGARRDLLISPGPAQARRPRQG